MANRKISDLTALTATATGDLLPIVDISEAGAADQNKKITIENLFKGIPGNVGIGTSWPTAKLHVETVPQAINQAGSVLFGPNVDYGFEVRNVIDGSGFPRVELRAPNAGPMLFFAGGATERMRIGSIGYLKASNTGAYTDTSGGGRSTTSSHFFRSDQNAPTILVTNTNTSSAVEGFTSDFPAGATGNHFIGANALSRVFIVAANGNVTNTNNSYGAISDIKLKENIVDANSQWDDLKALQVRNYNFKEGQTHTQIGLVAQEVELVSPGLVSESPDLDAEGNDLGTVTKSVNYSVLYMKAVKALQEAMERIETLEARLTAAGIA